MKLPAEQKPGAATAEVLDWIVTEIGAGKCLVARSDPERAHNNACDRAIAIIRNYAEGCGLFQMTARSRTHDVPMAPEKGRARRPAGRSASDPKETH